MRSKDEVKKDCTNCLYFDIETFYSVCNKHGVILNSEKPCEDFEEIPMSNIKDIEKQLNTGKWAYTIIDEEIYFKYLGNKDKTNLGYSLHFDWAESKEILE